MTHTDIKETLIDAVTDPSIAIKSAILGAQDQDKSKHTDSVEAKIVNVPSLPHEPVVTSAEIGSGMWSNNFRQKTAKEIFEDFKKQFQLPDGTFIDHSFPPHEEGEMEKWFIDLYTTLQANQSQQVEEAVRKERERCIKVVEDYGKSMSELLSEMVGNSHEDSKMMLAYDMHSRLIAVRHITNKLTPNHQD